MVPVAVIGLGNPLMSDEGIGVRVVEALRARADTPRDVDLLDLGTGGMQVVHELARWSRVIFVDCALLGEPPGTLRRFTPDQVVSKKIQPRMSLHEGDLFQSLELSRQLGECPADIVIFGIQPERVALGDTLSPTLMSRMDTYVEHVLNELRRTTDN